MKSLISKLKDAIAARGIRKEALSELKTMVEGAVADGKISESEAMQLKTHVSRYDLSPKDVSNVVDLAYSQVAARYMADRRITESEKESLQQIGRSLGVTEAALAAARENLDYYGLLNAIASLPFDQIPSFADSAVILADGETDYFSVYGSLLEERVVSRQTVGNSHGVSIRIMKGVSYRVGQSRGQIISHTGIVPVSYGEFAVTSHRLVFSGDKKSVNTPFSKLQNIEMFSDGLRFSVTNRQKPVTIQFGSEKAAEIVGLLISRILNK